MMNDLHSILDIEAGLREVLLHSHYATQLDGLHALLDIEAGLGQILLTKISSMGEERAESRHCTYDEAFPAVGPEDRLALRQHPRVRTSRRLLTRALDHDHALGLSLRLARKLAHHVDRPQVHGHTRQRARSLAHDLAFRLRTDRERATELTAVLARSAGSSHNPIGAGDLARGLDHARALDLVLDLAHALSRDLEHDLAGQLIHCLTRDLGDIHDAARTLVAWAVTWVRDVVSELLGREVFLDQDMVYLFLDDFTTSDLRSVRLSDVELEGVRWSETGTWWPDDVDIEHVRARSDVLAAGSGLWVIRSSAATVRDFVDC
ncbi:unnamed protein product [[Actinomadura] parvosata subsp. kistnae]|nr:unnamed protein product [Actinomadura parvosata subsp. kistnae]